MWERKEEEEEDRIPDDFGVRSWKEFCRKSNFLQEGTTDVQCIPKVFLII